MDMTSVVLVKPRRRLTRRTKALLLATLIIVAGWFVYVANFGECDTHSKFCVLDIAGTRSEIGFEWQGWHLYVSTSGEDPATHVLF